MKTTVELPDDLLIEAKKRAAEQRRPLRALFADALRRELTRSPQGRPGGGRQIRWVTAEGGLPPVDVSDRASMHEWISHDRE